MAARSVGFGHLVIGDYWVWGRRNAGLDSARVILTLAVVGLVATGLGWIPDSVRSELIKIPSGSSHSFANQDRAMARDFTGVITSGMSVKASLVRPIRKGGEGGDIVGGTAQLTYGSRSMQVSQAFPRTFEGDSLVYVNGIGHAFDVTVRNVPVAPQDFALMVGPLSTTGTETVPEARAGHVKRELESVVQYPKGSEGDLTKAYLRFRLANVYDSGETRVFPGIKTLEYGQELKFPGGYYRLDGIRYYLDARIVSSHTAGMLVVIAGLCLGAWALCSVFPPQQLIAVSGEDGVRVHLVGPRGLGGASVEHFAEALGDEWNSEEGKVVE